MHQLDTGKSKKQNISKPRHNWTYYVQHLYILQYNQKEKGNAKLCYVAPYNQQSTLFSLENEYAVSFLVIQSGKGFIFSTSHLFKSTDCTYFKPSSHS